MIPFARDLDDESLVASLTQPELSLIHTLAAQVADMLGDLARSPSITDPYAAALYEAVGIGGSAALHSDPAIARLLPDAYADDADASRDFRGLTERSLAARKVANARVVIDSLDVADETSGELRLAPAQVQSWLRTLADIRLTIAVRLGIETDDDAELKGYGLDGDGPDGDGADDDDQTADDQTDDDKLLMRDVYDWLGWVTESLLEALE